MEKNSDHWSLLAGQLSYAESELEVKREKLLKKTLSEAKKSRKDGDWPKYWASLYQAATQVGFDDSQQEEDVVNELDNRLGAMN